MTFDLGEARRKRGLEEKVLTITGPDGEVEAKYRIVGDLPAAFLDEGSGGRFVAAIRTLFVDETEAEEFLDRYRPSLTDLGELLSDLYPGFGAELGEALASGRKSISGGNS